MGNEARRRAEHLADGVRDGTLRSRAFRKPFRGVYAAAGTVTTEQRIRDVVPVLPPDGVVGGWAAAWLHGAEDLDGWSRRGDLPVLICVPRNRSVRERPGIAVLRSDLAPQDVTTARGIPVTSGTRTALDLARLCPDPRRGVIAIDALWNAGVTSGPEVLARLAQLPRLRGGGIAAQAAEWASPRVRSPKETELRMIWTRDAGLPAPLVNELVVDGDGNALGHPDLLDEESGLVGEFDGRGHLDLEVSTVDNVRQEGLERNGLVVVRFTSLDTAARQRVRTVHRIQDARRRALAAPGPRSWRVRRS
jgi:hypothetical protein